MSDRVVAILNAGSGGVKFGMWVSADRGCPVWDPFCATEVEEPPPPGRLKRPQTDGYQMNRPRTRVSETGIRGSLAPTLEIPPLPDAAGSTERPRRPDLLAEARRRVLLHLANHGPSAVAQMPRAMPVSRFLLQLAATQLIARGLIRPVPASEGGARGLLRITELGQREFA